MSIRNQKVYRATGINTRSNAKLELRGKRASTTRFKIIHKNLCDNMDDKTKNEQCEKNKKLIMEMFPHKHNRRKMRSLILDSSLQRTRIMMEKLGAWKTTIVERDPKVAKFHAETGIETIQGKLEDVIATRDEQYNFMGADSESGPVGMLTFFRNFIEGGRYADKCILHLNVSGHAGYGNKGETHQKFQKDMAKIISNNENKCNIVLHEFKAYSCHRDNKVTKGAPMYNYWFKITRK